MVAERIVSVRNYVSPSKLPGVDYVINPYVGCPHKCMYCYAEFMKRFTDHTEPWGGFVDVKKSRAPIDLKKLRRSHVMMSSVTDPYNPYEKKYGVTRKILERLAEGECSVGITTKSYLVVRDIDILRRMPDVQVAVSMNTTDDSFRRDIEPYASSVEKRIEAIRKLRDAGIRVILFMSPIFPMLTDIRGLLERTVGLVDEFWFEHLKLRWPYRPRVMDYVRRVHAKYANIYRNIYEEGGVGYWSETSDLIDSLCANYGVQAHGNFLRR
jgi:DNA repair photolyase